jgi:integrase
MAHKRQRSGSWEYIVKRKILPKPLTLTFHSETEGDEYVRRLEALLDAGIVPEEFAEKQHHLNTISDIIRMYRASVALAYSDEPVIELLNERIGSTRISEINHTWAERWIISLKQTSGLAPSTIRKHVGSLARCFDWAGRKNVASLAINPLRGLPKRYAVYNDTDSAAAEAIGKTAKTDVWRDRRISEQEEINIREMLTGKKLEDRERARALQWQGALELMFDLALESAMRMREIYSLHIDQIDITRATIFLDKTKNGDKRQVPLTSVAQAAINRYLSQVASGGHNMQGWAITSQVFPWLKSDTPSQSELHRVTGLLSKQFKRIFEDAGAKDLNFHDLRHEATSRFFEKTSLSDLEIAKITGHKDPRMLMRYANLRASNLATKLW